MATNPNHRPPREQRARNPKPSLRCMDACVSTNVSAWSVNYFYLMVRRRGIKCVHLPNLFFFSNGSMEGRH